MEITYSPLQEWKVLRNLVMDNNKEIMHIVNRFARNIQDIRNAYIEIGYNFLKHDEDAVRFYESKNKKNWQDSLSSKDLFALFNFQNKLLERLLRNCSRICFEYEVSDIANNRMNVFLDKIKFTSKPPKNQFEDKCFDISATQNICKILQDNVDRVYTEFCESHGIACDKLKMFLNNFNLGRYHGNIYTNICKEIEKAEKEKLEKQVVENQTPYLPGMEEFINEQIEKKNRRHHSAFERELF